MRRSACACKIAANGLAGAEVRAGRELSPAPDDLQERRELQGGLPDAREDAEAAPGWTEVVPARVAGGRGILSRGRCGIRDAG